MQTDLFADLPPSLSPRLAWLQKHGLELRKVGENKWRCSLDDENFGSGADEDAAVDDFCARTKINDWNTP